MSYGFLRGVVTKVENHGMCHVGYEVLADNGVTCYASDIYGNDRLVPVGTHLCLEEATVLFENGRMVYLLPEDPEDVLIGKRAEEYYTPPSKRS